MASFIELAVKGRVEDDEIDDYVDRWHKSTEDLGPLNIYLGMSDAEYAAWSLDPDVLPHIITAHKQNCDFQDALRLAYEERLAARSGGADKLAIIQNWLAQHS